MKKHAIIVSKTGEQTYKITSGEAKEDFTFDTQYGFEGDFSEIGFDSNEGRAAFLKSVLNVMSVAVGEGHEIGAIVTAGVDIQQGVFSEQIAICVVGADATEEELQVIACDAIYPCKCGPGVSFCVMTMRGDEIGFCEHQNAAFMEALKACEGSEALASAMKAKEADGSLIFAVRDEREDDPEIEGQMVIYLADPNVVPKNTFEATFPSNATLEEVLGLKPA